MQSKKNPELNYSALYGAGRIVSRMQAKYSIQVTDYKKSMEDIYTTSINENTIDEAPMAYKSIDDILNSIYKTIEFIDILNPVYNFKVSITL